MAPILSEKNYGNYIGMKVEVQASGHHYYGVTKGYVLAIVMTVENFNGNPMQVPALVMNIPDKNHWEVVPLKQQYYTITVVTVEK